MPFGAARLGAKRLLLAATDSLDHDSVHAPAHENSHRSGHRLAAIIRSSKTLRVQQTWGFAEIAGDNRSGLWPGASAGAQTGFDVTQVLA